LLVDNFKTYESFYKFANKLPLKALNCPAKWVWLEVVSIERQVAEVFEKNPLAPHRVRILYSYLMEIRSLIANGAEKVHCALRDG
jgi:hypothetical protein